VPSPWIARALASCGLMLCLALGLTATAAAQSIEVDRQRGLQMLDQIHKDLVEHYYDPMVRGIDLDALVARARQRIGAAGSLGEIFAVLGGVCLDVKDSHVWFLPPRRVQVVHYGWTWRAVGDRVLVSEVSDGSDAAAKGLRIGDTVVEVAGYALTRANHATIAYLLWELRPQPSLTVVVERDGIRRTLVLASRFVTFPSRLDLDDPDGRIRFLFQEFEDDDDWHAWHARLAKDVLYWRIPRFLPDTTMSGFRGEVRRARAVVLDLRGNPGGSMATLQAAAGLFAPDTELLTRVNREGRAMVRTAKGDKPFPGDVVVLVDSETASAGELLARFLQIRSARLVGDRTAGYVTAGRTFAHAAGDGPIKVLYKVQVAVADGILPDGKRLEGVGVTPDIVMLPTPDDLLEGRDPVLVHAAGLVGVTLDPKNPLQLKK
jgi:C-terminal processing protease CtpA/Prc